MGRLTDPAAGLALPCSLCWSHLTLCRSIVCLHCCLSFSTLRHLVRAWGATDPVASLAPTLSVLVPPDPPYAPAAASDLLLFIGT